MILYLERELCIPPDLAAELVFFTFQMELLYNLREQGLAE